MRAFHILRMVEQLTNDKLITLHEYHAAIQSLSTAWSGIIAVSWFASDVVDRALEIYDVVLTDDEAQAILDNVLQQHDASIGVNWDVIDTHILEDHPHFAVGD